MGIFSKKKSLSELLRAKANPLSTKSGKAPASRSGLLAGATGADRAREAFERHRKTAQAAQQNFIDTQRRNQRAVQAAQETFKNTLKRNRGY
jgi:hypothetical protein